MTSEPYTLMMNNRRDGRTPSTGLYTQAKAFTHPQPRRRRTAQLALERRRLDICRPFLNDPSPAPSRLSRRIERHIRELFVFVAEPDVPADNNAAERSLCHLVISRKVSGGTRSEPGHTEQDDAGLPLRHLARARSKLPRFLPTTAHFPATLNCYPDGAIASRPGLASSDLRTNVTYESELESSGIDNAIRNHPPASGPGDVLGGGRAVPGLAVAVRVGTGSIRPQRPHRLPDNAAGQRAGVKATRSSDQAPGRAGGNSGRSHPRGVDLFLLPWVVSRQVV